MYSFEWRHKEMGLHCHIRCEVNDKTKSYDFKRSCRNTFKNLIGNMLHVNFRQSNINNAFVNYVSGRKDGMPKKNAEGDSQMRFVNNLDDVYSG